MSEARLSEASLASLSYAFYVLEAPRSSGTRKPTSATRRVSDKVGRLWRPLGAHGAAHSSAAVLRLGGGGTPPREFLGDDKQPRTYSGAE